MLIVKILASTLLLVLVLLSGCSSYELWEQLGPEEKARYRQGAREALRGYSQRLQQQNQELQREKDEAMGELF